MILSIPFPQVVIPNMASEKEEKTNKMNFKQIKPIFWEVYEAKNAQAKRIMNICGQKCCKTIKTILTKTAIKILANFLIESCILGGFNC